MASPTGIVSRNCGAKEFVDSDARPTLIDVFKTGANAVVLRLPFGTVIVCCNCGANVLVVKLLVTGTKPYPVTALKRVVDSVALDTVIVSRSCGANVEVVRLAVPTSMIVGAIMFGANEAIVKVRVGTMMENCS